MSSIRIKGAEMPISCTECPCYDDTDTCFCKVLDSYCEQYKTERHPNCPLAEIPTQHGRLIDADAAVARLKHLYCDGCGCDCSTCPWGAFIKYIDGRPTIIEPEE